MSHKISAKHLGWILSVLFLFLPVTLSASGLFKPTQSYGSGGDSFSVAVADVNGDGKPDLVVANQCFDCNAGIGVLLGNGDGTFQAVQTYDSGADNAFSVTAADVNGDGKPDVLVANECLECASGVVSVLLGNGNGTFNAAQTYSSGGVGANSIAVGDVNKDGKSDLLVAVGCGNPSVCPTGAVGVLLGNGNGTFQTSKVYFSGGSYARSVAVADVNGDGKPDLIVANENDPNPGAIGILLGKGDGTFQSAHSYSSGGKEADGILVADVNLDGKFDLLVSNVLFNNGVPNLGQVGVLLGNGDGTFQAVKVFSSGSRLATSIAVADVNRDGKPDVVVTNWGRGTPSSNVAVLLGNGDGTFQKAQLHNSGGQYAMAVAAADVNGDRKIDLLVANESGGGPGMGAIGVLLGTTKFATATNLNSSPNPSVSGQAVTLTATVVSTGSTAPTGKVAFKNGVTLIGSRALTNGVATLTTSNLPAGTLSITATYVGDIQSAKSISPVLIQVVNAAPQHP